MHFIDPINGSHPLKVFTHSIRDMLTSELELGLGLGKPKQDGVRIFGLSANRIFGLKPRSETPRRSLAEHIFCGVSRNYVFLEMEDTVVNDTKDRKQVVLIVPVSSVCVQTDGVTMTSYCDEVLGPNGNYFYKVPRTSRTILSALIFRSKGSASCMKTTRVKLSGDKDALRAAST